MTTITITVPTGKAGEVAFFTLKVKKENFLKVADLQFGSIESVLVLEEATDLFEIVR